ncbi:zeatin o-glucosyltransferase [Nicotiana attenuata]|uniref:Glycosyltransferase n=1 Tax=Nicotiana attenuata TaxID=49451 RepID=A0A1J6K9X2_NICAT|nr:zeatin o-glucosyltransferase [Nicotiana attenuata]
MATNTSDNINQLNEVIVAMVPFPDYSHLTQLFVLGRFISHNIPVHFLCLADRNQDLKLRVQGDLRASNIHFHDILVPSSLAEIEDVGDGLPSIVLFIKSIVDPIRRACIDLSTNAKRFVIIHDSITMDHVRDVHSYPNVKSYMFHSISAFARYSLLRQSIDHIFDDDDDHEEMIEKMQYEFPLLESSVAPFAAVLLRKEHEWKLNSGEIMNSCRELEGKYIDLLANAKDNKPWLAVGPLYMLLESHDSSNRSRHECLEFLDKQDVNSVILVSFGTTTTFSQEQVSELALGLEQSNHKFIWVLRETDKKMGNEKFEVKDEKIELPKGFKERTKGRGMVVINWEPQLEILGHPSTGGFFSHCGWNSCIESISMGVPLATWPIQYDQPYNAILVTNVVKIGTL